MYDYIQSETAAQLEGEIEAELKKLSDYLARGNGEVLGNTLTSYSNRVQELQGAMWVCMIVDNMLKEDKSKSEIITKLNQLADSQGETDRTRDAMEAQARSMIAPFSARISDSVQK